MIPSFSGLSLGAVFVGHLHGTWQISTVSRDVREARGVYRLVQKGCFRKRAAGPWRDCHGTPVFDNSNKFEAGTVPEGIVMAKAVPKNAPLSIGLEILEP
jgi:hypothetical protein